MRGLFTAGVIDVMMENNIKFNGAVGVSAGAAFGCNYKSGQIGRVLRYNKKFCNDKRYCGLHSLITSKNIYNTDFCYNEVPLKHDVFDFDAYKRNPMEFYVVATNVETGKPVYRKYEGFEDHGFDWIRASASVPLVSQIVTIDNYKLLDGGISDSIPIRFFEKIGFDRNIVVLTQPKGYQKKKNSLIPIIKLKYKKYPHFVKAMETRHQMYNETLEYISQKENRGELYVIRPENELSVGVVEKNPDKLEQIYNIGRATAQKQIDNIKEYLQLF